MASNFRLLWALGSVALIAIGCRDGTIDASIAMLGDDDPQVRRGAVRELETHGAESPLVVPALERALADHDPTVRLSAALALARLDPHNSAFRPVIRESLASGHAPVLVEIGRMGRDAEWAVPTLVELTGHREPHMRALAVAALGQIGGSDAEAVAALQQRLRDPNSTVRNAARAALDKLESQPSDPSGLPARGQR